MAELMLHHPCMEVRFTALRSTFQILGSPQPTEQPCWRPLVEQRTAVHIVIDDGRHHHGCDALPFGEGKAFRRGAPRTRRRNGTLLTTHTFGCAHGGTQFHQGLVPIAGAFGVQRTVRPRLNIGWGWSGLSRLPSHDPPDVPVHAGHRLAEGNARHGGCGVRTNTGEGQQRIVGGRQTAIESSLDRWEHNTLAQRMKPASSTVVARSLPRLEHRINRGARHGSNRGKRLDHALPIHQASANLRLLKENLAEENGPRVVSGPPRQVTLVVIVPFQQRLLVVGRQQGGTSGFSEIGGFRSGFFGFDFGIVGFDLLPNQFSDVLHLHFRTDGA